MCIYLYDPYFAVWMDMRTTSIVDDILNRIRNRNKNYLKPLCGLPISPYFSALKLKWLIENVSQVQEALAAKRLMFGTIDSWLIWVCAYENTIKNMSIYALIISYILCILN